jgi:hypothetical protein
MLTSSSFVLLLVTCEVYISALTSPSKMSGSPTSTIVTIKKRLQKKGYMRPRRSYHDNRIDTFPAQPVYFNERSTGRSQPSEHGASYHSPYGMEMPHDDGLDLLMSLNFDESPPKDDHPIATARPSHHREPLDLASLLLGDDEDLMEDSDLPYPLLPAKFDFNAPVSERAQKEARNIMDDFTLFLELKASGALDACLKRQK